LGGNFSRREAREPCHAPQISYPIPRADRFLPTCVHHRHIASLCVPTREKLQNVLISYPPRLCAAHLPMLETKMSTTHRHDWRINLGCSDPLPAHHHSHHTLRMWWASSVPSLSHSNRLSTFNSPVVVPPPSCPPLAPSWRMMGA